MKPRDIGHRFEFAIADLAGQLDAEQVPAFCSRLCSFLDAEQQAIIAETTPIPIDQLPFVMREREEKLAENGISSQFIMPNVVVMETLTEEMTTGGGGEMGVGAEEENMRVFKAYFNFTMYPYNVYIINWKVNKQNNKYGLIYKIK